jgi:peroxiredoxin
MALTPSRMTPLGTIAPDFSLPDCEGKTVRLSDFRDAPGLLVIFLCNHCPYVKHVREELARFSREYRDRGLAIVGINANDFTQEKYAADRPEAMREELRAAGYAFPYLVDAEQSVAKAYGAACTPDFFLFDGDRRLVYRGQFDDSRPGNGLPVTGGDLRRHADALLTGRPLDVPQRPSIGCNIKWKPGNEPRP